jgi:hypothetical protein
MEVTLSECNVCLDTRQPNGSRKSWLCGINLRPQPVLREPPPVGPIGNNCYCFSSLSIAVTTSGESGLTGGSNLATTLP